MCKTGTFLWGLAAGMVAGAMLEIIILPRPRPRRTAVGKAMQRMGNAIVVPVEEDNHAGRRLDGVIRPLATVSEPLDAVDATCEFGNDTGVDVAALVGAPGNKAGTPFHTAAEAIP